MPMWRRARRGAALDTGEIYAVEQISPRTSTSRLMHRISVLFPVPDGPMIAVIPVPRSRC
jgi:hypothetical protein